MAAESPQAPRAGITSTLVQPVDERSSTVVTLQCQAALLPRLAQALSNLGEAGSARVLQQASGALLSPYHGKQCQSLLDCYVLPVACTAGSCFLTSCLVKVLECLPCDQLLQHWQACSNCSQLLHRMKCDPACGCWPAWSGAWFCSLLWLGSAAVHWLWV